MTCITSTSIIFNKQKEELTKAFNEYRKVNEKIKSILKKLGYTIKRKKNHYKLYWKNKFVCPISSSPSDINSGKQIIRAIKRFFEKLDNIKN